MSKPLLSILQLYGGEYANLLHTFLRAFNMLHFSNKKMTTNRVVVISEAASGSARLGSALSTNRV